MQVAKTDGGPDMFGESFGSYGLIQSSERKSLEFAHLSKIVAEHNGKEIWVRGRVHVIQFDDESAVIILRQKNYTAQVSLFGDKAMKSFVANISKESVVDIFGVIRKLVTNVSSCTQSDSEIEALKIFVVSSAEHCLPVKIEDASRQQSDHERNLTARLDNRSLDLRTPASQAIFAIQAGIVHIFREILNGKGFTEIMTPKIITAASEGCSNFFKMDYFKGKTFLAQSQQLYKQMAITADFDKVYTIGTVFRSEDTKTHRHITEFVVMDIEMAFDFHYHEVMDTIGALFIDIFKRLEREFAHEIAAVSAQFPAEPFKFREPALVLTYPQALELLREAGVEIADEVDLFPVEKALGSIVRAKYDTDFYILDKFPLAIRPYYTMPDATDARLSNAYDMFIRGEEILSGSQRIHDATMLTERAKACGIDLSTIQTYIDSFRYGCPPHAGGGIGLERVTMLFLGLHNIRLASLFPRDQDRITP